MTLIIPSTSTCRKCHGSNEPIATCSILNTEWGTIEWAPLMDRVDIVVGHVIINEIEASGDPYLPLIV